MLIIWMCREGDQLETKRLTSTKSTPSSTVFYTPTVLYNPTLPSHSSPLPLPHPTSLLHPYPLAHQSSLHHPPNIPQSSPFSPSSRSSIFWRDSSRSRSISLKDRRQDRIKRDQKGLSLGCELGEQDEIQESTSFIHTNSLLN